MLRANLGRAIAKGWGVSETCACTRGQLSSCRRPLCTELIFAKDWPQNKKPRREGAVSVCLVGLGG